MKRRHMSPHRERAVNLLSHYIGRCMRAAGLKVNSDVEAELQECVDAIVDAAVEEAKADRVEELGA